MHHCLEPVCHELIRHRSFKLFIIFKNIEGGVKVEEPSTSSKPDDPRKKDTEEV